MPPPAVFMPRRLLRSSAVSGSGASRAPSSSRSSCLAISCGSREAVPGTAARCLAPDACIRSSAKLLQLLEQLLLLLVHALRHLDAHAREHVALARAVDARRA